MKTKIEFSGEALLNTKTGEVLVFEEFFISGLFGGMVFSKFRNRADFEANKDKLMILKRAEENKLEVKI